MPPERKAPPHSQYHAALGKAIQFWMVEKGLDKDMVSTGADLDIKQLNALIRGTSNPQLSTLIRLADGLNTPLGKLMTKADELRDECLCS